MLNLHAVLPRSRANGPGVRFALWLQGCSLACQGCFNPETHSFEPRLAVAPCDLVERLVQDESAVEGITISGGEPFEQPDGLLELLRGVRARTHLSVILFSGYTLPEIQALAQGNSILAHVDVLIAGRYDQTQRIASGLRGSANKTVHLLTGRYSRQDIEATPDVEVTIGCDGSTTISGIAPPRRSGTL
jgi:anaerobic ribonucleoside-triphosphate reductase activating protein